MTLLQRARDKVRPFFLERRLRQFRDLFPPEACGRVVDLGGTSRHWRRLGYDSDVTIVNVRLRDGTDAVRAGFHLVEGDGRRAPFPAGAVDLAFSNSVIEHVGSWDDQRAFAQELLRVGRQVYCQTPNRRFFVEPHLIAPFVHWLPRRWRTYPVVRWLTVWGWSNRPTPDRAAAFVDSITLLSKRELRALFPRCEILTERFLGVFPKSFIVVRRDSNGAGGSATAVGRRQ